MLHTPLSTAAQTAYAALRSASLLEGVRSVASLPGSFSKKTIKGRDYWYYQMPDLTGKQKQIFLGLASEELAELIGKHRRGDEAKTHLRQLTRQAIAAACPAIVPAHAKIIERLADAGFFQAGGILVGTHVYMAYQNYLGVRWQSAAQTLVPCQASSAADHLPSPHRALLQTLPMPLGMSCGLRLALNDDDCALVRHLPPDMKLDLDFAHAVHNVSIAIPSDVTMDMGSDIEALKMGFVPVRSLTTYVKSDERDLQIDFVTSMHRGGDTPVLIKALNVTMQPLKFMEFSMEAPIQVTLLAQRGPITVNAPPPEKYALHKLLVYGERPQNMRIKASKDLEQAASLIEYLAEYDAELLTETWADLLSRGPGWRSRALEGLQALQQRFPDIDTTALNG